MYPLNFLKKSWIKPIYKHAVKHPPHSKFLIFGIKSSKTNTLSYHFKLKLTFSAHEDNPHVISSQDFLYLDFSKTVKSKHRLGAGGTYGQPIRGRPYGQRLDCFFKIQMEKISWKTSLKLEEFLDVHNSILLIFGIHIFQKWYLFSGQWIPDN